MVEVKYADNLSHKHERIILHLEIITMIVFALTSVLFLFCFLILRIFQEYEYLDKIWWIILDYNMTCNFLPKEEEMKPCILKQYMAVPLVCSSPDDIINATLQFGDFVMK